MSKIIQIDKEFQLAAQELGVPISEALDLIWHHRLYHKKDMVRLFVYGNLREGGRNRIFYDALARRDYLEIEGEAYIHGMLYNCGRYPAFIPARNVKGKLCEGVGLVKGEIWRIKKDLAWGLLHHLEGYWPCGEHKGETNTGSLYLLRRCITLTAGQLEMKNPAMVYVYNGFADRKDPTKNPANLISSGDWIAYKNG